MKKQDCACKSRNGDVSDCYCYRVNPSVSCQKTILGNGFLGSGANPGKY